MKTAEKILIENNILIKEKWNNGAPFPFPLNLTRDTNIKVTKDIVRCMEEYGKEMYNQAIEDVMKEIAKVINNSPTYSLSGLDLRNITKLKKQ